MTTALIGTGSSLTPVAVKCGIALTLALPAHASRWSATVGVTRTVQFLTGIPLVSRVALTAALHTAPSVETIARARWDTAVVSAVSKVTEAVAVHTFSLPTAHVPVVTEGASSLATVTTSIPFEAGALGRAGVTLALSGTIIGTFLHLTRYARPAAITYAHAVETLSVNTRFT